MSKLVIFIIMVISGSSVFWYIQRIEYLTGTVNWYPRKKIKDIANVVSRFYDTSDEEIIDYLQTKSTNFSKMFSKCSSKKIQR